MANIGPVVDGYPLLGSNQEALQDMVENNGLRQVQGREFRVKKWVVGPWLLSFVLAAGSIVNLAMHQWVTICGMSAGLFQFYPDNSVPITFDDVLSSCIFYKQLWDCSDICSTTQQLQYGGDGYAGFGITAVVLHFLSALLYLLLVCTSHHHCIMAFGFHVGDCLLILALRVLSVVAVLFWVGAVIYYGYYLGETNKLSSTVDVSEGFGIAIGLAVVSIGNAVLGNYALWRFAGRTFGG